MPQPIMKIIASPAYPKTTHKPMFQHRHYAEIAAAIMRARNESLATADEVTHFLAKDIADVFCRDNPRFDYERFMLAAEGRPITKKDKR